MINKKEVVAKLLDHNRFVIAHKMVMAAEFTPEEKELLKKFYGFQASDFEVDKADKERGLKSQMK